MLLKVDLSPSLSNDQSSSIPPTWKQPIWANPGSNSPALIIALIATVWLQASKRCLELRKAQNSGKESILKYFDFFAKFYKFHTKLNVKYTSVSTIYRYDVCMCIYIYIYLVYPHPVRVVLSRFVGIPY